jgi:Leucine-rich repeat (LRR) protein
MRDLAFYILGKGCGKRHVKQLHLYRAGQNLEDFPQEWKSTLQGPSKAWRLSLDTNKLERLPENFYAPKLVSLLLGGNPIQSVPDSFLGNFTKLRVLDLRNGKFDRLPEEVGNLTNLVCLDLSYCMDLKILPDTVWKLQKLKCLIVINCWMLKYLPSGLVKLTSLQILDAEGSDTWAEHTPSNIARTESLDHVYPNRRASLEDVCKLVALTKLSICGVVKLPYNISALTKLKILRLELANVGTLPAEMAYQFKQLQQLDLLDFGSLKYLPNSFTLSGGFPALLKLRIQSSSLVKFPEVNEGALPKLRTLEFESCECLGSLPLSLEVLTNLRKLILLNLCGCTSSLL